MNVGTGVEVQKGEINCRRCRSSLKFPSLFCIVKIFITGSTLCILRSITVNFFSHIHSYVNYRDYLLAFLVGEEGLMLLSGNNPFRCKRVGRKCKSSADKEFGTEVSRPVYFIYGASFVPAMSAGRHRLQLRY